MERQAGSMQYFPWVASEFRMMIALVFYVICVLRKIIKNPRFVLVAITLLSSWPEAYKFSYYPNIVTTHICLLLFKT